MASLPPNIGWIGLGLMGYPMATNLLHKLPHTDFHVFDIMPEALDSFVRDGGGRVHACASSREVADKSVCLSQFNHHPLSRKNKKERTKT